MDPLKDPRPSVARVRDDYLAALLAADVPRARRVVEAALHDGMPVAELYLGVLQATLYEVGRLWQTGEGSVAQEHLATATTRALMARLSAGRDRGPDLELRAITTATENDYHSLPPRFVADFLEADGWTVFDLGAATPTDALLDAVGELRPVLVCLSTTLSANLVDARAAVAALRALPAPPFVAVGGQAWGGNEELARRSGADLFARDAVAFLAGVRGRLSAAALR